METEQNAPEDSAQYASERMNLPVSKEQVNVSNSSMLEISRHDTDKSQRSVRAHELLRERDTFVALRHRTVLEKDRLLQNIDHHIAEIDAVLLDSQHAVPNDTLSLVILPPQPADVLPNAGSYPMSTDPKKKRGRPRKVMIPPISSTSHATMNHSASRTDEPVQEELVSRTHVPMIQPVTQQQKEQMESDAINTSTKEATTSTDTQTVSSRNKNQVQNEKAAGKRKRGRPRKIQESNSDKPYHRRNNNETVHPIRSIIRDMITKVVDRHDNSQSLTNVFESDTNAPTILQRKRGRPRIHPVKVKKLSTTVSVTNGMEQLGAHSIATIEKHDHMPVSSKEEQPPTRKRRGRPPKNKINLNFEPKPKQARGRPRKSKNSTELSSSLIKEKQSEQENTPLHEPSEESILASIIYDPKDAVTATADNWDSNFTQNKENNMIENKEMHWTEEGMARS